MDSCNRRSFLKFGWTAISLLLAGCLSGNASYDDSTTNETTDPGETESTTGSSPTKTRRENGCRTTELSTPTPTSTDEVEAKSYPEVPVALSKETAIEFATSYEKAYAWNQILIERGSNVRNIDLRIWGDPTEEQRNQGFWISFSISVGYSTRNSEADDEYTVAYYVSSKQIRRGEVDDPEGVRPEELDQVLYCS